MFLSEICAEPAWSEGICIRGMKNFINDIISQISIITKN